MNPSARGTRDKTILDGPHLTEVTDFWQEAVSLLFLGVGRGAGKGAGRVGSLQIECWRDPWIRIRMSRRDFVNALVGGGGTLATGSVEYRDGYPPPRPMTARRVTVGSALRTLRGGPDRRQPRQ